MKTKLDINAAVAKVAMKSAIDEVESCVVFVAVQEMSAHIGGIEKIQKSIVYLQFAIRVGIWGRVFVKDLLMKMVIYVLLYFKTFLN